MASIVIKNWDNKTWLSSNNYIKSFNNFLSKNYKFNSKTKILDIGCGRGKIIGNLRSKYNLKNKPIGIDVINHKDKDKRIKFKKIDVLSFFKTNKQKFDFILIKQSIHFLSITQIKKLIYLLKNNLNKNGKIFIFTLDTSYNEIPTFRLMRMRLNKSLKRDKMISDIISKLYLRKTKKRFIFNVKISKKKYVRMIENKFISILLSFSKKEISKGIFEINHKYQNTIKFKDKLICMIL